MELIGKGKDEKGAVWLALRVPDGYICAHANHARITTFPLNDPENCMYSSDVITFAKRKVISTVRTRISVFLISMLRFDFEAAVSVRPGFGRCFNRVSPDMGNTSIMPRVLI